MKILKDIFFKLLYAPPIFRTIKTILYPLIYPRVFLCKLRYSRTLYRIKSIPGNKKLRVLFLVGEPAKWKCQKLYEAMESSKDFDPIVGLTAWNSQSAHVCTEEELEQQHKKAEAFFHTLGDKVTRTYTNFPRKGIPLNELKPDIIFYSEPWLPIKFQTPERMSGTAVCCYIPYFVPSTGDTSIICEADVHRFCHTYFTLSDSWSELYSSKFTKFNNVQQFVGTGLPALDYFSANTGTASESNVVIYAPHHSIPNPNNTIPWNISTFDWSGRPILEYAKKHPEIKWVFKPHPLLKHEVVDAGFMSQDEIDAYYREWNEIGTVCLSGDYQDLFINSTAMITDCGSFLSEYGASGHPLIRLVRTTSRQFPPLPNGMLDTYYQVRNLNEMFDAFRTVLENKEDPKRDARIAAVKSAGLMGVNASANIVRYLTKLCGRSV